MGRLRCMVSGLCADSILFVEMAKLCSLFCRLLMGTDDFADIERALRFAATADTTTFGTRFLKLNYPY